MAVSTAKLILAAALIAAGAAGGYGRERRARIAEVATLQRTHAVTLADIAGKTLASVEATRKLERAWNVAQEASAHETATQLAQVGRDRATADAAAVGLRRQLADYLGAARRSAAGAGPAPAFEDQSGGDALGVLADVLGRADERAGVLGIYADRLRIAGAACERDYDALTASSDERSK